MALDDTAKSFTKHNVPKGNEPSIKWDGEKGFIDTPALADEPDQALWETIIADWGLSPDKTEIVDGSVHIRAWDSAIGGGEIQRMRYYRASIRKKQTEGFVSDEIKALLRQIQNRKPIKASEKNVDYGNRALLCLASDWQLGKGEGGGPEAAIERICAAQDKFIEKVRYLRKVGRGPSVIYVVGMGDLVENCDNHYAMQRFTVRLDRREQKDAVIFLLDRLIELLVNNFPDLEIIMAAVPGNHGENRNSSGKAFTQWTDNDDLDAVAMTYRAFTKNPERYGKVSMPQFDGLIQEDMTITLNVCGVNVGFAHGHQFRNGANAAARAEGWWKGQVMGEQPIAAAKILFAGHLHHAIVSEATGRTFFQCPAMDGGSAWFTSTSGASSPAGMLTIGIGTGYDRNGWGDYEIL